MRTSVFVAVLLTASLLFVAGCDRSRSDQYPDRSADTTRRVEDIRQNARDQKDAVDVEADRMSTRHDFDERQIRQKYRAERQEFANSSKTEVTGRDAKIRDIEIQAKHDKGVIDAEVTDKLKTSPREEAAQIRVDAAARKSEIDREVTKGIAPIRSESERSKAAHVQRGLEIDRDESREISALEQERAKARNHRNDRMLEIDQWTNEQLAQVGRDSKVDRDRDSTREANRELSRDPKKPQ